MKILQNTILYFDERKFNKLCKKCEDLAIKTNKKHVLVEFVEVNNKFRIFLRKYFKKSVFLKNRLPRLIILNNTTRKRINHKTSFVHISWSQLKRAKETKYISVNGKK